MTTTPTPAPTPTPTPASPSGDRAEHESIERTATNYMIPLAPGAKEQWRDNEAGFEQHAKDVASGLYPTMAPQIQAGVHMRTLMDPYVQVAKQVLGPETEPDFHAPAWARALEGGLDPKTGRASPMPLTAWRTYLMTNPTFGYDRSPEALQRADEFIQALHASFGLYHP